MYHTSIKLILFTVFTLGLSGCFDDGIEDKIDKILGYKPDASVKSKVSLRKSENCNEVKQYLSQSLIDQYLEKQGGWQGWCPNCRITIGDDVLVSTPVTFPATSADTTEDGAKQSSDPASVSGTNNQVTGVDELDQLKTDSKGNMFLIRDNELIIVDAFPADEMAITGRLTLETASTGLFVDEANQKAIVIGLDWVEKINRPGKKSISEDAVIGSFKAPVPMVVLSFINIEDLANPEVIEELRISGNFQSARMIEDRLHLVINHWLAGVEDSFSTNKFNKELERYWKAKELNFDSLAAEVATLRKNLSEMIVEAVNEIELSEILPYFQGMENQKSELLACSQIYHTDISLKSSSLLSVVSLNSDGSDMSSAATFASGGIVYASRQFIYIAQPSNGWWWNDLEQQMVIHKFSLSAENTEHVASGLVAGAAQNAFNFSEFEGNLRVATTESRWPDDARGRVTYNHLFVLKDDGEGSLVINGSVENFAKNESIMSARFIGDKGFVVTFERIDPLFTFDLSDPTNPLLMGELEIPGFSSYMHPIGDNHLLTIGRSGTQSGQIEETQLQLFDISDLSHPVRMDAHVPEILKNNQAYGYSIAEADSHAFSYSADNNILAIPLSFYNWQSNASFAGIATFKIDVSKGNIAENGLVDHSDLIDSSKCENDIKPFNGEPLSNRCLADLYRWDARPNRSVITQDLDGSSQLYSISRLGMKASDLNNMDTELSVLAFKDGS